MAGSPKFGDKAAWAPRIQTGIAAMTASVIKGKGGSSACEADIRAAVEFMAMLAPLQPQPAERANPTTSSYYFNSDLRI